ncbi:MAG: hypothetical protein JXA94_04760 [Parachlamydiales bacterium]|nr:hypothetical protein [Parachlamydiales bacterium]
MKPDFSNLELLISKEEIKSKIIQMSFKIDEMYKNKEIVILAVLKGSIIFVSDLIREIKTPFSIEFIKASSHGQKGTKKVPVKIHEINKLNIQDKHVLIIDDIFDSGETLNALTEKIYESGPASLKTLCLLFKKNVKRKKQINPPDLYLFEIENQFVIGYGLDHKEYFRGLKGIYSLK